MGFSIDVSVPVLTVFLQGIVSFFSPCILPLIPLYIGYLSGGTGSIGEDGRVSYDRGKVMLHTICFVIGISFTFFLLGLGASALGNFFKSNQLLFARVGGILIFLFGLYQLGMFGTSSVLERDRRLPLSFDKLAMSPFSALLMGFTFSFAWTPCVGPALASVLIMAASAKALGFALIGVYTLGFVLPFLAVGFFTTTVLEFFKTHRNIAKNMVKIGGVLMMLMGIFMFTGRMNAVTGYLSSISSPFGLGGQETKETAAKETLPETEPAQTEAVEETTEEVKKPLPAVDFTLQDQFGNTHALSDYKGKTIFLNFWATWCPPCRAEMPDIQKLYETQDTKGDNAVIILGVAAPNYGTEKDEQGIKDFLKDNGYTYPVLMDTSAELFEAYGIYSFPTTYMIDREGNVFGYVSGQLSMDMMHSIIEQTLKGERD